MKQSFVLIGIIFILAGCATTHPKTPTGDQCQTADWHAIGILDGKVGSYPHQFGRYQKRCGASRDALQAWESGRQIGLKTYCTESTAYEMGRRGFELHNVCPDDEKLGKIQQSHGLGYQQYYLNERLNRQMRFGLHDYPHHPWFW